MSNNLVLPQFNKVFLNGRICQEVQFKQTSKGELAIIRIAINKFVKGKKHSIFVDLQKWDPPEGLKKFLIIGMPLQVEGVLGNDKDINNKPILTVKATYIQPMKKIENDEQREQVDIYEEDLKENENVEN